MKMAAVGVLFEGEAAERRWAKGVDAFERYVGEMLAHAGISFEWVEHARHIGSGRFDILLVALASDNPETEEILWQFAAKGGAVIAFGGFSLLRDRLGCEHAGKLGRGYAHLPAHAGAPLRFLQADIWTPRPDAAMFAEAYGAVSSVSPEGERLGAALLRFRIGRGSIDRWAPDIFGTVVGIQQGTRPVTEDGQPAPDGTANLDEGILKADDGFELDWKWDRRATVRGTPFFAYPYTDLWREVLVSQLVQKAVGLGATLPVLGYWPDGVSQVGLISFDSDLNHDESAETTLRVLSEQRIRSTWCMLEPGYSPHIYERANADGHELALHYNAVAQDNGVWSEEEFTRQANWLKQAIKRDNAVSNKNHYTRFEGWGELFRWCEANGIRADQTRGPSKRGNVGFLFGTCHPYFPISRHDERNRHYDVLEIGFLTQDLDHPGFGDSTVIEPFLEQVRKVEGVAHFLFHQVHLHRQEAVREAFRLLIQTARQQGFAFWTCEQIDRWERARRKVRIRGVGPDGSPDASGGEHVSGAVVWVPLPDGFEPRSGAPVAERYGVKCLKAVLA
jgi:hypothetical protein